MCIATIQPQVLEDSADDLRVFDAGDDLHSAAALSQDSISMPKTRLRRCAQVIARCFGTALPCPWPADPPRPRLNFAGLPVDHLLERMIELSLYAEEKLKSG